MVLPAVPRILQLVCMIVVICVFGASCSAGQVNSADLSEQPAVVPTEPMQRDSTPPASQAPAEPQAFVPAGRVGSADAYDELIDRLSEHVPVRLRAEVPWPDLRNADPTIAQRDIFRLWIWMLENHPDPRLIDAIAAPDSPDRVTVAGVFGELAVANQLNVRLAAPYRAYDQRAVTWESAGLPLWLTRDVPEPAVVLYYRDDSGPATRIDRDTGAVINSSPSPGARSWVSIMVETDVGWLLWRDTEIDRGDPELDFPEIEKPSGDAEQRRPNV